MSRILSTIALAACLAVPGLAYAEDGGAAAGAVTGGVAGAVVGGPVGAAVGAGAGAVVGGAVSGPEHHDVIVEQPATTGTVVEPCSSRTVKETNGLGESRKTTTSNCP